MASDSLGVSEMQPKSPPPMQLPESIFTSESDAEARQRIRYEVLIHRTVHFDDQKMQEPLAFVLHDVFSPEECMQLRGVIDDQLEKEPEGTRVQAIQTGNRECDRIAMKASEFSNHCFARVRPFLDCIVKKFRVEVMSESGGDLMYKQRFIHEEGIPDEMQLAGEHQHQSVTLPEHDEQRILLSDERSLNWEGTWELDIMKEVVSCLRYQPGDQFGMHDDHNQDGPGGSLLAPVKSLFTGLLYLNADFAGGNTNMLSHAEGYPILLEINPGDPKAAGAPGSMLFFFQKGMLHEGYKVQEGHKYVMRADLFYRQVESTASETQRRGLALLQEARELYAAGDYRFQKRYHMACELNSAIKRMTFTDD